MSECAHGSDGAGTRQAMVLGRWIDDGGSEGRPAAPWSLTRMLRGT